MDLNQTENEINEGAVAAPASTSSGRSTDVQQQMTGQIDKLDALFTKTDNAHYSMSHQNQQMKSFMK